MSDDDDVHTSLRTGGHARIRGLDGQALMMLDRTNKNKIGW